MFDEAQKSKTMTRSASSSSKATPNHSAGLLFTGNLSPSKSTDIDSVTDKSDIRQVHVSEDASGLLDYALLKVNELFSYIQSYRDCANVEALHKVVTSFFHSYVCIRYTDE